MYMVVVACAGVAHTGFYSREKQLYSPVLQPVTLYTSVLSACVPVSTTMKSMKLFRELLAVAMVLGKRAAPDGPGSDDEVDLGPTGPPVGAAVCQPVHTLPSIVPCAGHPTFPCVLLVVRIRMLRSMSDTDKAYM
jgi:hypothetical protein